MSKKLLLSLFIIGFFGVFTSCQKDKITDVTTTLVGTFTCTLNNASWSAPAAVGTTSAGNLVITATKGKELITLNFSTAVVGKYPINLTTNSALYTGSIDSTSSTTYMGITGGEIEITSIDATTKRVSGTFHFEGFNLAMNKVTITNGSFKNINYN